MSVLPRASFFHEDACDRTKSLDCTRKMPDNASMNELARQLIVVKTLFVLLLLVLIGFSGYVAYIWGQELELVKAELEIYKDTAQKHFHEWQVLQDAYGGLVPRYLTPVTKYNHTVMEQLKFKSIVA